MEDVVVSQSLWGRFKSWLKKDWNETKVLFRNLPAIPFAILCICLVAMNFLANKGWVKADWAWSEHWFSADAGMIVSWIAFLAGDMIVKIYGTKAAIKVNFTAIAVQLLAIILFTLGAMLPWTAVTGCGRHGVDAGGAYIFDQACEFCQAMSPEKHFDSIFMALFWPCFGGTMAFALATVVDSVLSKFLLTRFKDRTNFKSYAVASYVSTALGQLLDNLFFALFFSMWQGWFIGSDPETLGYITLHLLGFSAVGMVVELIGQAILSPVGFWLTKSWRARGTGNEYIALVEEAQEVNETNARVEKTKISATKVILFIGSFLSIVGACVLSVWARLHFVDSIDAYLTFGQFPTELKLTIVFGVYALAILGFVLYLVGAFVKNKKVVRKELTK